MQDLTSTKFEHLLSYCLEKKLPPSNPFSTFLYQKAPEKHFHPIGAYTLRGLDMEAVIALKQLKNYSKDGLQHYLFIWYSKEQASKTADGVHASLQVKSLNPPQFSLRGRPHDFVRILGESSIIQSILVELIDDLKCLENFTIYNKKGSQRDAKIPLPSDILGTRFIVQTLVSEEPTKPMHGKLERMEIALPQLIDLANYSIMTGVKMYGPVTEFSNFCPKCGKKLPHGKNKFCIHCGEKIE